MPSLRCPRNGESLVHLLHPRHSTQPLRALNKHVGRRWCGGPARIPANTGVPALAGHVVVHCWRGGWRGRTLLISPMHSFSWQRVGVASSLAAHAARVAVGLTAVAAASAHAANLDDVVVSATRSEQRLADVVADITVVDSETIERSGQNSVAELLSRQPGVQITSNGGPATTTNVFVRGASNQYTAVYLDGVRLDSQVTSGGVTWQNIPLAMIDRIEILRGPAAAVYGSDAMSGVILLFTKKGEGSWKPWMGAGYGTHGSYRADAGMRGSAGAWDYSLAVVREGSRGFDAQPASKYSDNEGYSRTALNASLGLQINAVHRLQAQILDSKTQNDYVRTKDRPDNQFHREMQTVGASWTADWTERYRSTLSINTSEDKYTQKPSQNLTKARLNNLLWQNEVKLVPGHKLSAAYERRNDSLINPSVQKSEKQTRHQDAIALGYGLTVGAHTLQLNARHDKDSEFGGKSTGSAAYAWNFTPQWRVSASMGTAFRVPTLYQRFSVSGDIDLKPEESRNQELGLRWVQGDNQFSATAYRNKFTNMLKYEGTGCAGAGCYENVERAVLEGLTLAGAYRTGAFKWHGSVDFQNPRNEKTGNMLARRSQRYAMLGVDTELQGWTLGAEMQSFSRRHDKEGDAKTLAGYTLFNLSASRQIARDFTLTARVDNLMDRDYALVKGYATAGRTLYMGLKWMPQ